MVPTMDDDDLVAAVRARAADPERRVDAQVSAFGMAIGSMDLRQMFDALGQAQADMARLLQDPLNPPPDLQAKASMMEASMRQPAGPSLPPPATEADVAAAEAGLGIPLPPLLRRLYLEVANGGFGPGYGIVGVGPNGWVDDRRRELVALHASQRDGYEIFDDDPELADRWRWPVTLLPFCYLGDVVHACVDTARPGGPVLEYDPSDLDWDDDGYPLDEEEALGEVSPSLAEWLSDWVTSPSAVEQQAAMLGGLGDADAMQRDMLKRGWAMMSPEERAELGITDWHLATGELPDSWK